MTKVSPGEVKLSGEKSKIDSCFSELESAEKLYGQEF